jgi:hypothetical protein
VSQTGARGVLPLRPLTVGELLDGAVTLLRVRWRLLVGCGLAAAAIEQAVLFPLRRLADVDAYYYPPDDRWDSWTLLVIVGFATEAAIIAGLGFPAARAAPRALLGSAAPAPEPPARPALAVAPVAAVAGVLCGLAAAPLLFWQPPDLVGLFLLALFVAMPIWIWAYGSLGLAVPAAVIDRLDPVRAVGRSVVLAHRGFLRTLRVRGLGYLGWFIVRWAWGWGMLVLISAVYTSPSPTVDNVLMAAVYVAVNALAYPVLACLDTLLHLEARMRTEGVDIALRRALDRGLDPAPALVMPRAR